MNPVTTEQAAFAAALACATAAERAACLDAHCGTDDVLRRRVEALLRAAEAAGDFLEANPALPPAGEIIEQPGDRIGRYKLLEKIGEGGCGVVYMAEQEEPVRRRVALKVIKPGMDTRSVIARFEAERQALAMMEHVNIAQVFDGGATPSGRPYFVMELVRGVPVTAFCDEAGLSTGERLQLFLQICQAVQHAHQKGVIHRDLKPSNILVTVNDGVPVPKVIDFGIAKATGARLTDKSLFTQFQAFIGTPAYTSPEQAEMSSVDIDTRSDIYSLGVLLYELLTSRTPFNAEELLRSGLDEMRRIIRTQDPPRPSNLLGHLNEKEATALSARRRASIPELTSAVRGDLDWIVMKCLEKDRARRYETASGLAADVRCHLQHEPIAARPPGRLYLLRKLLRRNKGTFAALAAIALALCAGTVVSVWQALRARRGEARAQAALDELRSNAPDCFAQALTLSLDGKISTALIKLDEAIRLSPANPGYLMAKADLLDCMLRFGESAAIYRSVCELDPANTPARARLLLATQLARSEDTDSPAWRDTLERLYLQMTEERTRSLAQISAIANPVRDHAIERLKARASPESKIFAGQLKLDSYGLLVLDIRRVPLTDISALRGLPIRSLYLRDMPLADISPLRGMPLMNLSLSSTAVTSLEALRGMASLRNLTLGNTAITDIAPLRNAPRLRWLHLSGSPVADLGPLHGAPLEVLRIAATKVTDLTPLATLPLYELDCTGIPATDFSPLAACRALRHLDLSRTALRDLEVFRNSRLSTLVINGTAVSDLAPLAGSPVNYLLIADTPVTDISPLLRCPELITLLLSRSVKNADALRGLSSLKRLSYELDQTGAPAHTAAEFWREHPAGK